MDDKERVKLIEEEIEITMYDLRRLQDKHKKLTGRIFTPPVRMDKPIWARRGK